MFLVHHKYDGCVDTEECRTLKNLTSFLVCVGLANVERVEFISEENIRYDIKL